MGIKQTDILSFLEPESTGFIYDSARSFLKRHKSPTSLLGQLKSLLTQGQLTACRDMIQLIIRESHELADTSELYLLRAQVAYEQADNFGEVMAWVQQAKHCPKKSPAIASWDSLVEGIQALKEGDYDKGQKVLSEFEPESELYRIAQYEMAHHLFWRNIDQKHALHILETLCEERPEYIKAWSCLGFVYNRLGHKGKAQEAFGHCLELETDPEKITFYRQQLAS